MGSLIRPTTKFYSGIANTTPAIAKAVSGSFGVGGGYGPAKMVWQAAANGSYTLKYSTPTGTLSGGGAQNNSGASSSGSVSKTATANPGGNNSGNLSYSWGGGANFTYTNATSQTITATRSFSGVPNGSSSTSPTDTGLFCDITDNVTGAVWRTDPITMGPFTYTNTIPAEDPISIVASNVSANIDGFGSFTGTPSASAFVSASGGSTVYVGWSHQIISGDFSVSINNSTLQNPTFSKSMFCPSLGSNSTECRVQVTVLDSEGHSTSTTYYVDLSVTSVND